jgi:predicted dehydrogenase
MSQKELSRRQALGGAAAVAAFTIVPRHVLGQGQTPPSEKLNVAGIGIGGMGFGDITNVARLGHNIVAVCDVDQRMIGRAKKDFPNARVHGDFRVMLETQKDIDAVMVATPDHLHAVATMAALKAGKHVYCEKPLTHSVYEARMIGKAAREAKVATQMGNQGQASEEARLVIEMIRDGAIGQIREVHAWSNRKPDISPRGIARPKETPPVPDYLNWDLWVGPSPMRPYHPCYLPFAWRGWWDFGTGVLGDIGCHELSAIFKCLKLGHPATIEACSTNWQQGDEISRETAPLASITRYTFAPSENHGPFTITWYDGGMQPPRPDELEEGRQFAVGDGIMYVGDKGKMLRHRLIPETKMAEYKKPAPTLPRSPGHYQEWVQACKGGKPAGSDFVDHAAHLAEVVLLGNIAIRTNSKLHWDPVNMKFKGNIAEADALVNPPYRTGWSL